MARYSSGRFAELIGFTIEHLSHVEHGHKPLANDFGTPLENHGVDGRPKDRVFQCFETPESLDGKAGLARRKPLFELNRNSWKAAA